jgi:hypothetical protein
VTAPEGHQDGSALQRRTAAETARRNFTRYQPWADPQDGDKLKALSLNPLFDICRKVRDNRAMRGFDDSRPDRYYVFASEWEGTQGLRAFVLHCFEHLPSRPTEFHRLEPIEGNRMEPGNVKWAFSKPTAFQLRSERAQLALALFGEQRGSRTLPEGWEDLVASYEAPSATNGRPWCVPALWQSRCLCVPLNYWPECGCATSLQGIC